MNNKTCKKCFNYNKDIKYCSKFERYIVDTLSANVCKYYKGKILELKKAKCINCKNLNKYNYCYYKKRCFDFEERIKERRCSKYINKRDL